MIIQKGGENIPSPKQDPAKKMPDGKNGEPPQTQLQMLNPLSPAPAATPLLESPPATPVINPAGLTPGRPF